MLVATLMLPQDTVLKPGIVITESITVREAQYLFPNDNTDAKTASVIIKGDGITVDFNGATLRGTKEETDPDERVGTGVYVEGNNVTIKNLNVHGYKVGLAARNTDGLKIIDSDFSYNWKQRLLSTPEREDTADWMSYHHNEEDEWLRYGAGIYLRNCDEYEVKGCTAVGGQNGLMMTECNKGLVWNNDFNYLSSLGIGMYRSSDNRIMHNNIDWCVRGYSHGVYNRGQDSAGILIYEQSNDNVFAYNSVTHGGDGFFLWAGQSTMDDGKGGCNGNLLYGNDFSHAPTNGIEATFSKNDFVNNLIMECWHGIWGGYSWESRTIGNVFAHNAEGIAWEHGQDNVFALNIFNKDRIAVNIWQKDSEDPNWGYAKMRDTRSRDNLFDHNVFRGVFGPVFRVSRSANVELVSNLFDETGQPMWTEKEIPGMSLSDNLFFVTKQFELPGKQSENVWEIDVNFAPKEPAMQGSGNLKPDAEPIGEDYLKQFDVEWYPYAKDLGDLDTDYAEMIREWAPDPLEGGKRPFLAPGRMRGRKTIIIDEWGPYDFKRPLIRQAGVTASGSLRFEILGPEGEWRVKSIRGATISQQLGKVPSIVNVKLEEGKASDILIELEYRGEATVDYRGIKTAAGRPVAFSYSKFFAPIDWNVKWFNYSRATQDPRETDDWKTIIAGKPAREEKTDNLSYAWGGSPGEGVGANEFLTLAEGSFEIAKGDYVLELTSDDGVRVILDGKTVFEDWTWHAPKSDRIKLSLGGKHTIRIEHFELDGYSTLKAELKRA